MQIITVHGHRFGVESDGWHGHADDRDQALSNLELALVDLEPEQVAALHAALAAEGDYPDEAVSLCYEATRPVTESWADPDAPALMLSAA